jgi:hypothetical protein
MGLPISDPKPKLLLVLQPKVSAPAAPAPQHLNMFIILT